MSGSVRRPHALVAYWDRDEFRVENYLARRASTVPPALLQLLPPATQFTRRADLAVLVAGVGLDGEEVIDQLVAHGVLLEEDSELDRLDRDVARRWRWGHDARWFHFSSSDVKYVLDRGEQMQLLTEQARRDPPPPVQRAPLGRVVTLPDTIAEDRGGLWTTLRKRRTQRVFADAPLDLATLSRLMCWTWGATDERSHEVLGEYLLKTSPSGGARHPIDVYLLAHRVTGLAPRVYRYLPREHAVEDVGPTVDADLLQQVFAGHDWFREAPAAFVMTAVIERNAWKYRHSHAYRVLLLDAGHLGQTFHLVCTALGLAPFTSGAIDDPATIALLRLDPSEEIVVYGAATGVPGQLRTEEPTLSFDLTRPNV